MFGTNHVAPKRDNEKTFLVKSIFGTIQGEGPHAGKPATFIRLGGCNLKCSFCDTDFTSDLDEMHADEICNCILTDERHYSLIVITGGEPMLQNLAGLIKIISLKLPFVKTVQIETAGTVWPAFLECVAAASPPLVEIVVSPKTPKVNKTVAEKAKYWKYLISASDTRNGDDGLPEHLARPMRSDAVIYVQPMDEYNPAKNKANVSLALHLALTLGYGISLQQHKILGVE